MTARTRSNDFRDDRSGGSEARLYRNRLTTTALALARKRNQLHIPECPGINRKVETVEPASVPHGEA